MLIKLEKSMGNQIFKLITTKELHIYRVIHFHHLDVFLIKKLNISLEMLHLLWIIGIDRIRRVN